MSRKIDGSKIRSLREQKGWSQEHLSTVSGLGLRTIQRVEAGGKASMESALALASVFEVSLDELWLNEPGKLYDHYQISYVVFTSIILVLAFAGVFMGLLTEGAGPVEEQKMEFNFLATFLLVGLITFIFSSLRIRIDQQQLKWNFGLGVVKGSIDIAEINQVEPVQNKWWYGVGVRVLPHCILYNIYGLDAVEITQRNGKRTRQGTDEPDALTQAIKDSLARD